MNAGRERGRASSKHPSLLAGLLITAEGVPFTPSHAVNRGRRYGYYIERPLLTPEAAKEKSTSHHSNVAANCFETKGWRLPAHEIEQLVLKQVGAFFRDRGALLDAVRFKRKSLDLVSAVLDRASKLANACESSSFASHSEIVTALVRRITVAQDQVTIEIDRNSLAELLLGQKTFSPREKDRLPISIEVPVRFRRRGVEAKFVILGQRPAASEPNINLVKALARAHEWWGRIARGEARGIGDIARVEGFNRAYVTRFLCLAFLAPEITKAILEGRQPTELTAKRLISSALNSPLLWPDQIDIFRS
jgi:hypothetical protein